MSVLVTGGMGFIGSYVVRDLLADGQDVVTLDVDVGANQANMILTERELDAITVMEGDIADPLLLTRIACEHDVQQVVHLARTADTTGRDPATEVLANVRAFTTVLDTMRALSLTRLVWSSSAVVFGRAAQHADGPVADDAAQYPIGIYGACKSFNEQVAEHYGRSFGVDVIGLRFNYVYGFGRRVAEGRPNFDVGLFLAPARGETGIVPMADATVSWQYVRDVAGSLVAALRAPATDGARVFNTCGFKMTVREVAGLVQELLPSAEFTFLPGSIDFVHELDCSVGARELGYEALYPVREGVGDMLRLVGAAG